MWTCLDGDEVERVGERREGVEGRVGMSGTFKLLRTCLPWVAVAGGGILEGSSIVTYM